MTDLVQWVAMAVSLGLLVLVIELVRRRRLVEEHSFIWLVCAVALLGLSLGRRFLDVAARWLGVYYPPAFLFLLAILLLFILQFQFSTVISDLREQNRSLTQDLGLLAGEVRELRKALAEKSQGTTPGA